MSNPTTQFKKGQSGNPKGRPLKGHSITETLRAMMDEKPEIKRALGTKILKMALEESDMAAIKLLWNYIDGMPQQFTDLTTNGESLNSFDDDQITRIAERIARRKGNAGSTSGEEITD